MKKVFYILLTTTLFLAACAHRTPSDGSGSAGALSWQEQYDLGIRYLSEGNYEEAILAFTAAIEIDPKRVPAYVGRGDAYAGYAQALMADAPAGAELSDKALEAYENAVEDYLKAIDLDDSDASVYRKAADIYIVLGDTESASELLRKGEQITGKQSLQTALDELEGVIPAELIPGSERWTALEALLSHFGWYGNYDCKTAAVRTTTYGQPMNALERMLTVPTCYSYNDELYPGEAKEFHWSEADPLEKWVSNLNSYMKVNAGKLEWIMIHIFNCSRADVEMMKKPILANEDEHIYYLDGYYYFEIGGIGGGFNVSITSVEERGTRYYVEYNLYDAFDIYYEQPEARHAVVSLKELDGKEYWSLYDCRALEDLEPEDSQWEEPEDDPASHIVDVILNYESLWNRPFDPNSAYYYPPDSIEGPHKIFLLDFDFDGIQELMVKSPTMGSGAFTSNYIYQVRGDELVEVVNTLDGLSWDDISLMRDRQTGEYFYVGYDYFQDGADWYGERWEKFKLNQGTIQITRLYSHSQEEDVATYYDSDRNIISQDMFERLQWEFQNSAEEVSDCRSPAISDWNVGAAREEKRQQLLDLYHSAPNPA